MIETLPLVLFIVMAELSIGAFTILFALDCRNQVRRIAADQNNQTKRSFLITYACIYIVLTGLTYLFQQNFSTPELLNTYKHVDPAWTGYLSLPLLLFFLLMVVYTLFIVLDKQKPAVRDEKPELQTQAANQTANEEPVPTPVVNQGKKRSQGSVVHWLHLLAGALTTLAGLTTLLVIAMIYRPVAAANVAGVFTVAGFFAGALALGGVMTAMWLGHWYLVTPALRERPLLFATTLVLVGVLAQVLFTFTSGTSTVAASTPAATAIVTIQATVSAPTPVATPNAPVRSVLPGPVVAPLSADQIGWLRILVGFVLPLVLGSVAWKLVHDRSFQSATGMLYLIVVCALAGESLARGLFLMGL